MLNIVYGELCINIRCLLCSKKIKNNKELNNKYGKYHKKCYEIEKDNKKHIKKSKYNIITTIDINETIINFD